MGSGDISSICAGMIHFGKLMMFYNSAWADGVPCSVSVQAHDSIEPPIEALLLRQCSQFVLNKIL